MRTKALPVVLLALSLAIPAAASAQVGVGARIGTTGLGADLGIAIAKQILVAGCAAAQEGQCGQRNEHLDGTELHWCLPNVVSSVASPTTDDQN